MIFGIGADVVEVERVTRLLQRYGERFARRVLTASELEGFRASPNRALFLAPVLLTSIGVAHDASGRPLLRLAPALQALSEDRGVAVHHITLSHERSIACAVVVLEGRDS
jgi:holo-[acyl-carrier protein] synthase